MQDLTRESDESLVERSRRGEKGATETLLNRYKNMVRAQVRRCVFSLRWEIDDLVQEGMVGLYSAIGDYSPDSGKSFKNFAYLCVYRKIVDAIRGYSRAKNAPLNDYVSIFDPDFSDASDEETPEEFLITTESRAEFWGKIGKELSDFEFRVLAMYLEGMSYAEICEATGKNTKSVDNALSRSKKKLQSVFHPEEKKDP